LRDDLHGIHARFDSLEVSLEIGPALEAMSERPAVKRGLTLMAGLPQQPLEDKARSILHGAKQFERR